MPLEKARTLKELYTLFDPVNDLKTEEELRLFYVDRHSDIRESIKLDLELKPISHLLFTGHRGSGKSTEINKLCSELDGQFFVVRVSFRNRPDVDYVDVILKAANSLFKTATDENIIKKFPAQIAESYFDMFSDFIQNKIYGEFNPLKDSNHAKSNVSAGAKINYLAGEFELKFEAEPESRNNFKKNSERLLAELVDKINMLSEKIKMTYGSPVLFIFEDVDKIDLKNSEEIFYKHSNTLASIRACAIYVIDIALIFNAEFNNAKANFSGDSCFCLPNVKLLSRDGEPVAENYAILEQLMSYRAENHLISDAAKEQLINFSGGLLRSLISLVQSSARRAIIKKSEQIDVEHVEHAVNGMRGDFIPYLNPNHYQLLHDRHYSKELDNQQDTQYLLQSLCLLEYQNGKRWCDVHPIILQEVERRVTASLPQ